METSNRHPSSRKEFRSPFRRAGWEGAHEDCEGEQGGGGGGGGPPAYVMREKGQLTPNASLWDQERGRERGLAKDAPGKGNRKKNRIPCSEIKKKRSRRVTSKVVISRGAKMEKWAELSNKEGKNTWGEKKGIDRLRGKSRSRQRCLTFAPECQAFQTSPPRRPQRLKNATGFHRRLLPGKNRLNPVKIIEGKMSDRTTAD